MPKFVFVYHGGSKPETEAAIADTMAMWKAWFEGMGSDVVDPGNPVGLSKTVYGDRVEDNGGSNPTSGYSLVNAKDMDDALAKAKACPLLKSGGSVEVAEAIEMTM